jgi:hypothetical protein
LRIPSALVVARSNSQGIFAFKINMEKKCTKCGEVKSLDEFTNDKKGKHGKAYQCKSCNKKYKENNREKVNKYSKEHRLKNKEYHKEYSKIYHKEYYKNNKEKRKEYSKIYRQNNKEKIKISKQECREKYNKTARKYYENNKENLNKNQREYYKNNKEKIKNANKKYIEKNKGKKREYLKKYLKERRKTDFLFRLRGNISANIKESLNKKGYTKRNKTYTILKCEFDFFMNWLNGVASNGYTYGVGDLNLDHVIPISLAETEDEVILLNHYSNYQLLSAHENIVKGNRYVNPINLKRVLEHHPEPNKIKEIYSRL